MTPVHAGDQLDHYQIEQLVARSGMASIYKGIDTRTGKPVAIKIPHPEMECDPIFFERFKRETDIGAKLDHPGVMKVFVDEDRSRVYMVMEWVEGQLLRRVMSGAEISSRTRREDYPAHPRRVGLHPQPRRGAPRSEA